MPANRMNRDQFYAAIGPLDDAGLRKILWTVYWRGNAQLRERVSLHHDATITGLPVRHIGRVLTSEDVANLWDDE